jgi:hypothetical protein
LAKYQPALDVLLTQAARSTNKAAPRIVIPAAGNGAASKPATSANKATPRKRPAKKP